MCDIGTVCCWDAWTVVPVLCLASQFFPSWASWHKSKGWTLLMWQSQVRWYWWQWWWALPSSVWAKFDKLNHPKTQRRKRLKIKGISANKVMIYFSEQYSWKCTFKNVQKYNTDFERSGLNQNYRKCQYFIKSRPFGVYSALASMNSLIGISLQSSWTHHFILNYARKSELWLLEVQLIYFYTKHWWNWWSL